MIKLLVKWHPVRDMIGTYETIEMIPLETKMEGYVRGLKSIGAISAEILSVNTTNKRDTSCLQIS